MRAPLPTALASALHEFFSDHLPRLRGMSPHTLHSYRDSLKLLLCFVSNRQGKDVSYLELEDIGPPQVMDFLQHLETDRHNTPATRNVRLAGIHSFFRFCAGRYPERLEHCQRMLSIPFKRTHTRSVEYLEFGEIQTVLSAIDRKIPDGRRDYALLVTMFNLGARVQEILDLRPCDLQLERPRQARLFGKGRKERICPLWPQTADLIKLLLIERKVEPTSREPLFRNHRGEPLTRFGIRYILSKYCERAKGREATLAAKRLHPHSMRHSTAVHLHQAGVDLTTISHWLGHASVTTTNRYTTVDLETKREAIKKAKPVCQEPRRQSWRRNPRILEWLESL
jgi:integrase/recombinase XerD